MTGSNNLTRLQSHLKKNGRKLRLQQPNKHTPVPQLILELGKDAKGRARFMHITERCSSGVTSAVTHKPVDTVSLRFFVMFPFQIREEYMFDLGRYLFRINTNCELGNLILRDKERLIVFQYTHLSAGSAVNLSAVDIIIGTVTFLLNTFEEAIEMLAGGAVSLKKFEEESYKLLRGDEFMNTPFADALKKSRP